MRKSQETQLVGGKLVSEIARGWLKAAALTCYTLQGRIADCGFGFGIAHPFKTQTRKGGAPSYFSAATTVKMVPSESSSTKSERGKNSVATRRYLKQRQLSSRCRHNAFSDGGREAFPVGGWTIPCHCPQNARVTRASLSVIHGGRDS